MSSDVVPSLVVVGIIIALLLAVLAVQLRLQRLKQAPPAAPSDELDPTTEALLEAIPFPAVAFGESMRRTYVNPAGGQSEGLVRRVSRQEWFQRAMMHAFLDRTATSRPANADNPEDVHVMPLPGVKVVAIIVDQSERFHTAALREDFIANASHELNTPAAAISLLAEALVRTTPKGSPAESFASSLVAEAERLTSLTRDIVRLSEVQDTYVLDPADRDSEAFLVVPSVERVIREHTSLAQQMGIAIHLAHIEPSGEPPRAYGNAQRFEVALGNLVENAIRHSENQGTVTIDMGSEGDFVWVNVTDTGIGIDPQHHQQVFQRFFRVNPARPRPGGGTGLGLSIARNTARQMGGDVTVRSKLGEGATFTITLPEDRSQV